MTGISLQTHGISLARVQRHADEGPIRLDFCTYQPLDGGPASDELLKSLGTRYELAGPPCTSVIPARQFSLLLVEAPEVDPSELRAAVRWRIKDLLDFHIDDAVIDVFDIPKQEGRGHAKMMYVVASRIAVIQEHIERLEAQEINLTAIDIPELVQRNIAELLPEDRNGVALLSLGSDSGLLTLTREGNLYLARTLDLGVEDLAQAMAQGEVAPAAHEDEGLAIEPLDADEAPEIPESLGLSSAVARLLDGAILEIQRSLDYYESHFSLSPISAMVVAPMERDFPGVLAYLSANLGIPARQLDLNSVLESEQRIDDQTQARCLGAIGAALRHEEKVL